MDCFLALSFLLWSVDTLNHFLSQTVIQGVFSNWDERRKDVLTWNSSHVLLGTGFHIGESPLCIFSCSICKHLIWKCRKEFFIRSTRFDGWQNFSAKPPKHKQKQNKGKVLHFLRRTVPKAGSRKSLWNECQTQHCVWDGGQGAAGRSEERGRSCIWVIESYADSPEL